MSKSKFLELSKKFKFLKKIYFFYNIYIRNYKFLKNGSQFQEDQFILRQFQNNYKGTYLDIGCFHPTRHNNTYKMHKLGWSGMNIDLNPLTIELFDYARPKDINLNIGISNKETIKKLYFIDELNTQNTLDPNQLLFLKNHHNIRNEDIVEKEINVKPINLILDDYGFNNIDFMNLDVEGHELEIIESLNFNKNKIKYLCIEMIKHNSEAELRSEKINQILKSNKYSLIKEIGFNYIYKNLQFN
jgi:hypothetical protein